MGADGGICWVHVRDRAAFDALAGWLYDATENRGAYAYKGEFSKEPGSRPTKGDWLEGAYGTDCDFDLADLCRLVRWLTDSAPNYCAQDPRDYSFDELRMALLTDPWNPLDALSSRSSHDNWWCEMDLLVEMLRQDGFPAELDSVPLREWGMRLREAIGIDSYRSEETWT